VSPAPATSPAPVDPQACKCFLGNLSYDITDDQVREFFKDCGEITDIHWLKDKESGEFYGSGFVEFGNGGAQEALKKAGEDFLGRPIKIDMAKPRAPRADGGGGFKKREPKPLSEKPEGCNTVFCGNLSYDIDDAAATKFFESCGEIANIRWLTDRETGDFKGCGFIEFSDPASVDQAVKKNGEDLMGRNIRIDYSAPRKPREKSW
jgi:nucleolin